MLNTQQVILTLLTSLCAASFSTSTALADDGGISFGGNPTLLTGHKSVSMKSEVIKMEIHKESIKVDCLFVFHNDGPDATVRMGFPDRGEGAQIPYEGEPLPTKNLKATFTSYDSWVDGKKVPTKLIPTDDRSIFWHTKTVNFKANKDCVIRDVYTLPPGQQVTTDNGMYYQTYYILHTAASWKGAIGDAKIEVTFAPDSVKPPLVLKDRKQLKDQDLDHVGWPKQPAGVVFYEAPCVPTVKGSTITFVKSNLRPTKKDDIHLFYGYRTLPPLIIPGQNVPPPNN
jgi:hypothetical protein